MWSCNAARESTVVRREERRRAKMHARRGTMVDSLHDEPEVLREQRRGPCSKDSFQPMQRKTNSSSLADQSVHSTRRLRSRTLPSVAPAGCDALRCPAGGRRNRLAGASAASSMRPGPRSPPANAKARSKVTRSNSESAEQASSLEELHAGAKQRSSAVKKKLRSSLLLASSQGSLPTICTHLADSRPQTLPSATPVACIAPCTGAIAGDVLAPF